jgi:hypothetical protein
MLTGEHKTQRMTAALTFYINTAKMVMNFCHIIGVTGDETWVSFTKKFKLQG